MLQGNQALVKAIAVIDSIAEGNRQLKDVCETLAAAEIYGAQNYPRPY
ncbi:hypothetical protein O9992_24510 [Vibrio lentus]|nr:hypothetical protein [Vibrio lentus]